MALKTVVNGIWLKYKSPEVLYGLAIYIASLKIETSVVFRLIFKGSVVSSPFFSTSI